MTHSLDAKWAALEFQRIRDSIAQGGTDEAFDIADQAWRKIADAPALPSQEAVAVAEPFGWVRRTGHDGNAFSYHFTDNQITASLWQQRGKSPTAVYAAPTVAPVVVSVKALEWQDGSLANSLYADTILGRYTVLSGMVTTHNGMLPACWIDPKGTHHEIGNSEEGRVASEADYEARILSAIIPAKPAGVVEAARDVVKSAFFEGFSAGEASGKFGDDTDAEAWGRYSAALQGATDGAGL